MHHIALHDFVPGLTQIAISPLGDMPVIRAEFAGLVRRRIDAGVCDESPLAVKASDISDLRNQARSQRVPDQGVEKEKMSLAQMMIKEKEPVDKISKYTGYAIDKLKEIASAMGQTLV